MSDKKHSNPILPTEELTPEKGGFVIFGRNSRGQLCVLTSFVQGRFSADPQDKLKYYGLAKGALDVRVEQSRDGHDGIAISESGLDGAIRETKEETGVDVRQLLGKRFVPYKAGAKVENFKSPIAGVEIKRAHIQDCADFAYISGAGVQRRLQLYYIELADGSIDHLANRLKQLDGGEYNFGKSCTDKGIAELLTEKGYPTFKDMMTILRTGKVRANGSCWSPSDYTLFENPELPSIEKHMKLKITDPESWVKFCQEISGRDFKSLKPQFAAIKKYFEDLGMVGDTMPIKMDDKDSPLCFYQEGGEILPLETLIMRSLRAAEHNPKYAKAMWGTYSGERIVERKGSHAKFPHAQISGFARMFENMPNDYGVLDTLRKVAMAWKDDGNIRKPKTTARAVSFVDFAQQNSAGKGAGGVTGR